MRNRGPFCVLTWDPIWAQDAGMNQIVALLCLEIGASKADIKKWRQRGMVPHKHRHSMIMIAQRKSWPLDLSDFDFKPALKSEIPAWKKRMARASQQVAA
jgi:hypothetical protein